MNDVADPNCQRDIMPLYAKKAKWTMNGTPGTC